MSPFQCLLQHCHRVTTGYGSTCPSCSHTVTLQIANYKMSAAAAVAGRGAHSPNTKYKKQTKKNAFWRNSWKLRQTECFIVSQGPIKSNQHAHFLSSAPSACRLWAQRANFMNGPHWVTVWDFNGLMFARRLHWHSKCTWAAAAGTWQSLMLLSGKWPHDLRQQTPVLCCVHLWPLTCGSGLTVCALVCVLLVPCFIVCLLDVSHLHWQDFGNVSFI